MRQQASYVLPDILPRCQPGASAFLYAHAARVHDGRSMISFTTNAVSIVLSGRKRLQHGSGRDEFRRGRAILFKPGQCLSTDMDHDGRDYRSLLLFFSDAHLGAFLARHAPQPPAARLARAAHLDVAASPALLHLADSLWTAPDTASLSAARATVKVDDVLLLLLEQHGAQLFTFFAAAGATAPQRRLRAVVEAHWRDDLRWEELAFLCHMSLSTFKRHFQQVYGCAPSQWLQEQRLQLAAHLLKVERRRTSEIYLDVGYATASAFTHSFKSRFGMTPKAYRDHAP